MKASSETSAKEATAATQRTGLSSDKHKPTPTSAEQYSLSGPSDLPDAAFNAYRKDLADIALAGRVIASHYAEAVERRLSEATELRATPSDDAEILATLAPGSLFLMLDDSLGWAWGYAGPDRRVGYLPTAALA